MVAKVDKSHAKEGADIIADYPSTIVYAREVRSSLFKLRDVDGGDGVLIAIDAFEIAPHFHGKATREFPCGSHGGEVAHMRCVHSHFGVPIFIENANFITVHGKLQKSEYAIQTTRIERCHDCGHNVEYLTSQ